jgi:hypothetical protein
MHACPSVFQGENPYLFCLSREVDIHCPYRPSGRFTLLHASPPICLGQPG